MNNTNLSTKDKSNFGNDVQTIKSMEVAEMVGKEHKNLLRDIREYISQLDEPNFGHIENSQLKIEPSDFFIESTHITERGKEYPCYLVKKKGCEFIAHKLTGTKGTLFTAKYINRFHEMEDMLKPKMPTTYLEALKELVAKEEENQRLLTDNSRMKPKEEFFDAVAGSKDAIEIGKVAKVLNYQGIGRNKLFEILRNKGVLMRDNVPYQKYIDNGCFRIVEQKYSMPDGETRINIKTLVYQKGVDFIRRLLDAA